MKNLSLILIIIFFASACKNKINNDADFTITGNITGYKEGEIVLSKYIDRELEPIDSIYITKGKFKFNHIKIETPELYYLNIDDDQIIIEFFMEANDIQINVNYSKGGYLEVQGSKTHSEYVAFLENNLVFENKQKEIYTQKEIAMSNNDTVLLQELDSMYSYVYKDQMNFIGSYINENNKSFVSAYIASRTMSDLVSLKELEDLTHNFADTVRSSLYYHELEDKIELRKRTQKGIQAADFSLADTSGINISLSSLQGKIVLLDFSASWNRISTGRNPILKEIRRKYKSKGFEIYQISFERNKDEWKNSIKKDKIDWICVSDIKSLDSDIAELYGIRKLPTSYLLDKSGVILYNDIKIEKLDSILHNCFIEE